MKNLKEKNARIAAYRGDSEQKVDKHVETLAESFLDKGVTKEQFLSITQAIYNEEQSNSQSRRRKVK
jgi:hypothetical protein